MSGFRAIEIRPSSDSKDDLQPGEGSFQAATDDPHSPLGKARKRRAPSHVSQNACTNCKKARARCDGEEPDPCSRCISRNISAQCVYDVQSKAAKEELVRQVNDWKAKYSLLKDSVEEKDRWIESVLQLFNDENAVAALDQSTTGQLHQTILDTLGRPPRTSGGESSSSIDSSRRLSDAAMDIAAEGESSQHVAGALNDEAVIHHLMALYFTWVHPVHMLFSERHFTSSFRTMDSIYCSQAMIYAMCAVGCCYMADDDGAEVDAKTLGRRFSHQAWAEIRTEEHMTPVSAVTYAILFLFELNQCQARTASSHLRLSAESLREVNSRHWTEEAFQVSLWGIQTLNTVWAAFTYQKPAAPISPRALAFRDVELDGPDALWQPYKHPHDTAVFERPSYAIETSREFAKLNQIIHETIKVYCGSRGRVSADGIMDLYRRYLHWKESLPSHLDPTTMDDDDPLPHVLVLHIHYYVAICQLFIPLIEVMGLASLSRDRLQGVTVQSAKDGLDLYQRYRTSYSNRQQPPLLSFCLVHLADALLRYVDQGVENAVIQFCLETLSEAKPGFAYIGALQAMFCESVLGQGLSLPPQATLLQLMGGRSRHGFSREEKLDCCERLTYSQPVDLLVERLDPNLANDFERELRNIGAQGVSSRPSGGAASSDEQDASETSGNRGIRIQRLVNP